MEGDREIVLTLSLEPCSGLIPRLTAKCDDCHLSRRSVGGGRVGGRPVGGGSVGGTFVGRRSVGGRSVDRRLVGGKLDKSDVTINWL
jgi:hypothetical protein